ncbi:NAC domain-containing protein 40-like isoform X2 [Salvia divinorum]|uniref:NAC domain-containing protein 40-like isoform X2 n=1 Tax=Salvia divinorum TaxID=28513 RepID=A0ABD1HN97_SALDI
MIDDECEIKEERSSASNIPMEISIAEASSMFPGFRFSPTDEELIQYYLKKKLHGAADGVDVIPEVDICRHEPWDLPAQSVIQSDNEWFFFSPRGRKYPNGSQSKRATASGYWKATGKERSVKSGSTQIGTKRTLVFHTGRAPKGQRTEWIMHEYTTSEKSEDAMVVCRLRRNREFHLNDNQGSDEGGSLAVDNSAPSLSGVEQSALVDGAKTAGSCSKDCSSSLNSHSVEQLDTGSESEEKEDDCYADIMKDDIIKLDESSLSENPRPIRVDLAKQKQPAQDDVSVLPSQGTANRRLRLRRHRVGSHGREHFGIYELATQTREDPSPGDRSSRTTRISLPFVFFVVVTLISLLVLLLGRGYIHGT